MNQSLLTVRVLALIFCGLGGFVVAYTFPDMAPEAWREKQSSLWPLLATVFGLLIGALLVLIDMLLKGFSLRALSALTFGLFVGFLASHFIAVSPLFETGDPQVIYISRVFVYIGFTYLATVIALRGKDEFNIVIPYVRFESEKVEVPLILLDGSSLVDGRVAKLCKARLLSDEVSIPKFVIDEMHELASSNENEEKNRGKRGLKTLNDLNQLDHLKVHVYDSEVERNQSSEDKLLFIVSSLKGRLLTTSESLIRKAKSSSVPYVDILSLSKALTHEVVVGEALTVKLVKLGKEDGQGVGYLEDGSMVVVNDSADYLESNVLVEVESIIPTSGGRMVFGKLLGEDK